MTTKMDFTSLGRGWERCKQVTLIRGRPGFGLFQGNEQGEREREIKNEPLAGRGSDIQIVFEFFSFTKGAFC